MLDCPGLEGCFDFLIPGVIEREGWLACCYFCAWWFVIAWCVILIEVGVGDQYDAMLG